MPSILFCLFRRRVETGSSPGSFLCELEKAHGTQSFPKDVPQIRLIPRGEIAGYLLKPLTDILSMRDLVRDNPRFEETVKEMAMDGLIKVDWAEQTYGITIDVPAELLSWL